jgi:hypothetical protein
MPPSSLKGLKRITQKWIEEADLERVEKTDFEEIQKTNPLTVCPVTVCPADG